MLAWVLLTVSSAPDFMEADAGFSLGWMYRQLTGTDNDQVVASGQSTTSRPTETLEQI